MPGPKGTEANMLNAESVPAKNPPFDHAASTEPCETAWIACSAGTSAPGSFTFSSIVPPEARSIFFESRTGASPISVRLVGNALARLSRTFCGGCCANVTAANEAAMQTAAAARMRRFMEPSSGRTLVFFFAARGIPRARCGGYVTMLARWFQLPRCFHSTGSMSQRSHGCAACSPTSTTP